LKRKDGRTKEGFRRKKREDGRRRRRRREDVTSAQRANDARDERPQYVYA